MNRNYIRLWRIGQRECDYILTEDNCGELTEEEVIMEKLSPPTEYSPNYVRISYVEK